MEAVALIATWSLIGGAIWAGSSPATDRRSLRGHLPSRALRHLRALATRATIGVIGWTHLIERALGVHRTPVATTPSTVVWSDGPATVRRYHGAPTRPEPVLLVHAFVSRPWILDLMPGRSLVRALLDDGFDVWLFDPGEGTRATATRGIDGLARVLLAAEQHVLAATGAERLHLVGYCTGGTLALARAGAFPHAHIGSIAVLATPVDVGVNGGMRRVLASRSLKPRLALDGDGCVPAAVVRESFHVLRPRALRSALLGWRARADEGFRAHYGALGRWVWEHRRLSGALFYDMVDLYRSNALIEGRMHLGDRRVDLSSLTVPILSAVASGDHIVPARSSHALAGVPGLAVDVLACPSGHVSMISGSTGVGMLHPALVTWLARRQTPGPSDDPKEPCPLLEELP